MQGYLLTDPANDKGYEEPRAKFNHFEDVGASCETEAYDENDSSGY